MDLHRLLERDDVEIIAQRLLGTIISTTINDQFTSGIIVETEAYKAPEDKGSHAFNSLRTKRTETLFSKPGTAYVYLCYGIHHLFNIVTGPKDTPHAVLFRAIQPIEGIDIMKIRRNQKGVTNNITNGPGKLSQALGILTDHNGHNTLSSESLIKLQLRDTPLNKDQIISSPRVGIAYAGLAAHWPWRFRIKDNPWTSLPHEVRYKQT